MLCLWKRRLYSEELPLEEKYNLTKKIRHDHNKKYFEAKNQRQKFRSKKRYFKKKIIDRLFVSLIYKNRKKRSTTTILLKKLLT